MKNLTIALMVGAALTSVGCKKEGGGTGEAPSAGGERAAPSAAPKAATAAKVGEGPVVPANALALHEMPPFKGVPDTALWTSVEAEKDGNKFANLFVYGQGTEKQGFVSVRIIDCNLPKLKEYAAKPSGQRRLQVVLQDARGRRSQDRRVPAPGRCRRCPRRHEGRPSRGAHGLVGRKEDHERRPRRVPRDGRLQAAPRRGEIVTAYSRTLPQVCVPFVTPRDVDAVPTADLVAAIVYVPGARLLMVYTPLLFVVVERPFDNRTVAPGTRVVAPRVTTPMRDSSV